MQRKLANDASCEVLCCINVCESCCALGVRSDALSKRHVPILLWAQTLRIYEIFSVSASTYRHGAVW